MRAKNKLVCGIGINDADYEAAKQRCPFYIKWKSMLERVYTGPHMQQLADSSRSNTSSEEPPAAAAAAAADPAGVRQLLLGCAELLRPAANCAVEWRCAALALMSSAVERFIDSCPGEILA